VVSPNRQPFDAILTRRKRAATAVCFPFSDGLNDAVRRCVQQYRLDTRVAASQLDDGLRQQHTGEKGWRSDDDAPTSASREITGKTDGMIEVLQDLGSGIAKLSAAVREFHTTRGAIEQAQAQVSLEGADDLRQSGLRHMEPLGRPGETSMLGDSQEGTQLWERDGHQ
jgi:hypothetical protein